VWNYEKFSSHVCLGRELIYEINNIFFSRGRSPRAGGEQGGKTRERIEDVARSRRRGRGSWRTLREDMAKVEGPGERLIKLPTCRA